MGKGKQKNSRKQRFWRRWGWRWLLYVPVGFVVLSILQVGILRFVDPPLSAFMVGRQLEALGEGDWGFRVVYDWRDLDEVSQCLPISLVASEDQNFPFHYGFDVKAIMRARESNAKGKQLRGGSTISQQVAKNLFLWKGRSWIRKGLEGWYTVLIELLWSKQRIMEVYVNVAEFGDGVYGAQAAGRQFWGKDAAKLSGRECAYLAVVLPAPRRYSAARPGKYVQQRASWVQKQVRLLGGQSYLGWEGARDE